MTRYLLSIGSNVAQAATLMADADRWLRQEFANVVSSGTYSSKAINGHSADYLNMLAEVDSELGVGEMTALGKEFEQRCGRTAESKTKGSVEMDIDVIKAGNVILRPVEYTRQYFLTGLKLLSEK